MTSYLNDHIVQLQSQLTHVRVQASENAQHEQRREISHISAAQQRIDEEERLAFNAEILAFAKNFDVEQTYVRARAGQERRRTERESSNSPLREHPVGF